MAGTRLSRPSSNGSLGFWTNRCRPDLPGTSSCPTKVRARARDLESIAGDVASRLARFERDLAAAVAELIGSG
jgi:hypothetical protein